jgi:hypothetical protein
MCWRTASSVAMFRAFVTTVSTGHGAPAFRPGRVASARATSVVVVPPFSPATWPGLTSPAASAAMRCFWLGCRSGL